MEIVECRNCSEICRYLEGYNDEWCCCYEFFKEYNTNTSTHYPTNEGNDIVRAYRK